MSDTPFHSETKTAQQITGHMGEDAAARFYEEQGYTVVERNLHILHNEIDLIVAGGTHLVFVEVKTRHGVYGVHSRYGRPAAAVDRGKQKRTVQAAEAYLRAHKDPSKPLLQPRIDVVEVYMTRHADGTEEVTHIHQIRNAFNAR